VAPAEVARRLRAAVGLPDRDGVLVREVEDESPAEAAGLRVGDLITAVGDTAMTRPDDLLRVLDEAGTEAIVLTVVRGADELTLTVAS
jgi:serine protease Do